ncbi:MAG: hypothetical protein IVW55_14330 [Chloroflexi bacterium]|nr:hypothetical protein [Chloroflexota bacterium]
MLSALLITIVTALFCGALGFMGKWVHGSLVRLSTMLGLAMALVVSLTGEGLNGGGVASQPQPWPQTLTWLGRSFYGSDTLSAGLGALCLLIGTLCLLKISNGPNLPWQLANGALIVATLYSLVHTFDLRLFAVHTVLLVLLIWLFQAWNAEAKGPTPTTIGRHLVAPGLGSLLLLGGAMIVGRTTGGSYSLIDLSLAALTTWPLVLLAGFIFLWLGLAPFTGWSAWVSGSSSTLIQALVTGVPVITLLLRLEALLTTQSLTGSVPPEWGLFTTALAWGGATTAVAAAAGMVLWAGTERWSALLTSHTMGLALWALALDNPVGRYAALAILTAFSAALVAYGLTDGERERWAQLARGIALCALAAAPLTGGFVGVWLLGTTLSQSRHPALALVIVASVVIAAIGVVLEAGVARSVVSKQEPYTRWVGLAAATIVVLAGILPGLWLPQINDMAAIAGGNAQIGLNWAGMQTGSGTLLPLLLALGLSAVAILVWLLNTLSRSGTGQGGVLLPTALARLQKLDPQEAGRRYTLPKLEPPAFIWWISLVWLESGVWGFGALLGKVGIRAGGLLSRLEGRYYLPLALIFTLLALLVVTR